MKTIYLIGGTMAVGKSTTCKQLKQRLENSVFLDGDWCWDSHPFIVSDETKKMVQDNICYLLNNFIHCSAYDNIIFCWVMHEQYIIDEIVNNLDLTNCNIKIISLICNEETLRKRIMKDIDARLRTSDVLERSIKRIEMYEQLNSIKIDTSNKDINDVVNEIINV